MPHLLSSLLHRTRTAVLALLVLVLPLHSVAQLVAGVQGHRHVHTGAATGAAAARHDSLLASLAQPLRAVLDRLHAAQDPRLQAEKMAWGASRGPAEGWHEHGGVFHKHSHDTADAVDVGDAGDEPGQAGATLFLAWLPATLAMPVARGSAPAAVAEPCWRDRVVAPPLTPPRG